MPAVLRITVGASLFALQLLVPVRTAAEETESNIGCIDQVMIPTYTNIARKAGAGGEVELQIVVGANGKAKTIQSQATSDFLSAESEIFLKAATYKKSCTGKVVRIRFEFKLAGEPSLDPVTRYVFLPPNKFRIESAPQLPIAH